MYVERINACSGRSLRQEELLRLENIDLDIGNQWTERDVMHAS